jgi:hypothetical protein
MAAKPRTSLIEAKRALVIEVRRNSLGPLVAVGLRWPTGVVAEDMSAAAEVDQGEDRLVAAEADVAVEADVAAAGAVVVVVPTSALRKTSSRWCASTTG